MNDNSYDGKDRICSPKGKWGQGDEYSKSELHGVESAE